MFFDDESKDQSEETKLKKKNQYVYHDSTKFMKNVSYFSSYKKHVQRLVENSDIIIACDPTDPNFFFSYVVFKKQADVLVVHYAYTKHVYRKLGLLTRLLQAIHPKLKSEPIVVTVYSNTIKELKEPLKLIFDPYILD